MRLLRFFLRSAFFISLSIGCAQSPNIPASPSQINNSQSFQAICLINSGITTLVCIDFPIDSNANLLSCSNTEKAAYAAQGANGDQYNGVGGNGPGVSTSCALTESTLALTGSCFLSDRTVRYYSNVWSTAAAQANCATRSGYWN